MTPDPPAGHAKSDVDSATPPLEPPASDVDTGTPGPPPDSGLTLDASVRRYAGGRVLLGGSPLRLLRLSAAAARRLDAWIAGEPIGDYPRHAWLARRLLDAGLAHPVPGNGALSPADVALVVPVKDDPGGVARLLAATAELAHRIVVDDGSAAPLLHATARHASARGPAAARNTGWQRASTELVAFLDADSAPEPGWLTSVLPLFDDPRVAAVAPRVRSEVGGCGPIAEYEQDHSSLDLGPDPAAVRPMSRVSYVPTAALVVRTAALAEVGGFDERLRYGEDVDLVWRLIAAGHTVRYQPRSVVWHRPRPTLHSWLRQRFDYGTSAAPLAARHPGQLSCARLSRWSAATWALAATGHPAAAVVLGAATTALLPRTLAGRGVPATAALALAGKGHLGAGRLLADATRRAWWPLALLTRRGRRLLLAACLPLVAETVARRRGPRWVALRIADDLAYGAGVWAGCLRHRTVVPLLPQVTEQPSRRR